MDVEREIQAIKERQDKCEENLATIVDNINNLMDLLKKGSIFDNVPTESEPAEKIVEIVSFDIKMVEDDDSVDYPYKLRLKNKTNNSIEGGADIIFLDEDGFEVHRGIENFKLAPNQDDVLIGKITIYDLDEAERVDSFQATVEVY